jgi:polyhydroxyalkanoate synthesis regulator phasin
VKSEQPFIGNNIQSPFYQRENLPKKPSHNCQDFKKQDIICYKSVNKICQMSNPVLHAFFLGRAFAEVLSEKVEESLTNTLSDLGKFDAEQRENLRQFIEEVQTRAEKEVTQGSSSTTTTSTTTDNGSSVDLQETIDDLRAEIARLKAEVKNYGNKTT